MNSRLAGFAEAIIILVILLAAPVHLALHHAAPRMTGPSLNQRLASIDSIDGAAIEHQADGDWLSNGRTYSEQRFSPLNAIDKSNVKDLGVAWEFRTDTIRGLESTPIVSDGVMFVTGSWSKVWALDAKTGQQIWAYDPHVAGQWGRYACCDVVNRGVAVWKGAVYVGTLDGRLVKLDAKTGKVDVGHQHRRSQPALHHHRRAAHRQRHGADRQWRRGIWRARLSHRLRRRYGPPDLALLLRAGRSQAAARRCRDGGGAENLVHRRHRSQMVGAGRRRHAVGFDGLRSRSRSHLYRHGQWRVVEPQPAFARRRRQSLSLIHRGAAPRYGRARLVLPDDARRRLGLHRNTAPDPRRTHHRWRQAQSDDAGAEERLLLCDRPRDGKADLGEALHDDLLGEAAST